MEKTMSICVDCYGGCCRRFNVKLTGYDILKIANNLRLDFKFFCRIKAVEEKDYENTLKSNALFKFVDLNETKMYRIDMKMNKSSLFTKTQKCMFLQEWKKNENEDISEKNKVIARCGIYENRALGCKLFPIDLHPSGLIGLSSDPNNHFEKIKQKGYELCPREMNDEDFPDEDSSLMQSLIIRKYETDYFKSISCLWNENPKSTDEFLEFLELSYKNRIVFYEGEE